MFRVTIQNIQNITNGFFEFNEQEYGLICIVGKNASGKTTLIRSLANIAISDIFLNQCNKYIFNENSSIKYELDDHVYTYEYSQSLKALDCKGNIPSADIVKTFSIESAFPYGSRYTPFAGRVSPEDDKRLRFLIKLNKISSPNNLIDFMNKIYGKDRYDNLKECIVNGKPICFVMYNSIYIREDFFSTGELFLINLYRTFYQQEKRIIIIDEIDSSLDAEAQVNLLKYLREYSVKYKKIVIFTTHSLALMKTLGEKELFYLSNDNNQITIKLKSYHYIKSLLYGFVGFDRFILVEDKRVCAFIEYLIKEKIRKVFFRYKVLALYGCNSVVDLYQRNLNEKFLCEYNKNILIILDGDQKEESKYEELPCNFLPFDDVEKCLYTIYCDKPEKIKKFVEDKAYSYKATAKKFNDISKKFYRNIKDKIKDEEKIFDFIIQEISCEELIEKIDGFLK